ncbi:MAG TPA: SigE family RNA polymerase sigma factor [Nocardioidaceae bacterium]|jgi:RNA polymerase sigma-70 factor (sigma-E family)
MSAPAAERQFEEFVTAAWPRLRWTAYLLCGDHHLAEDLTQTALARTYSAWRRIRRDDPTAYARAVLVNLNIDRMRRRRFLEVSEEQAPESVSEPAAGDLERREQVVALLRQLGDRERAVVVLRHYYDLSEAQVAAELGIPRGTVKSTLSRALSKMRVTTESVGSMNGRD